MRNNKRETTSVKNKREDEEEDEVERLLEEDKFKRSNRDYILDVSVRQDTRNDWRKKPREPEKRPRGRRERNRAGRAHTGEG